MSKQVGKQRYKGSLASRLRRGVREFLSLALSVSLVMGSLPAIPAYATSTDEDDDVQEFILSSDDLKDALQAALLKGNPIDEGAYVFDGAEQEAYEDLFYGTDVYELSPVIEDDKDGKLTLKVFVRLTGDRELDSYEITDEDEIVFLLLNRTDKEETARIYIDGYETDLITVVPKGEVELEKEDLEVPEELLEEIEETEPEEIPEETVAAPAAPSASGGSNGGSTTPDIVIVPDTGEDIPLIDPFDDGEESYGPGFDAGQDEGNADEGKDYESGEGDGSGWDAGDEGTDEGYENPGSADDGSEGSDTGDDGSSYDDETGLEDYGDDEGTEGGSSDDSSDGAASGSDSSDEGSSSEGSSDDGSGSDDSGDNGSDSGNDSASDGGSDSSSGDDSDNGSDTSLASISVNTVGLLAASMGDIIIEIDGDEVTATTTNGETSEENTAAEDVIVEDTVVTIASSSDADEEDEDDSAKDDGYIKLDGETLNAVLVNSNRSAVAFTTTVADLGMSEMSFGSTIYEAYVNGIEVTAIAPEGAFNENVKLSVTVFDKGSEEFADAADAIGRDADDDNMAALDISFTNDDGEEVEPDEEVQVIIDVSDILPEDADASTLKVTHLEEGKFLGLFNRIKPVVVADENEGYIDEDNAVITFSVDNFSVFTVTWDDGTGTTIEVHVYSVNGTSIDEELDVTTYTSTNSLIDIDDLVLHLDQNADYTNHYTFQYATVVYENQQGGGYSSTTVGSQDESVTYLSKSGTTYTVTRSTNSGSVTTTISNPDDITIHLYYSIPTVTLSTVDGNGNDTQHENTVSFFTSNEYFQGDTSSATYTWALSDDSLGTLLHPTSGEATFTWTEGTSTGAQVTVTVTMTVGDETASDTYTLTYGAQPVTITVYQSNGTTLQENVNVALVDASGNTVATGITGSDGTVTLYAVPGTYTVGVTYVYQSSATQGPDVTARATGESTITITQSTSANSSVTLGTEIASGRGGTNGSADGGSGPYYYEHIDVKIAAAETSSSDISFSDLDAVYVYDKYGNLIYWSEDLNINPETTDYNIMFDYIGTENTHSIVVSSEDTIVLVYEVVDNENGTTSTYTVSYRPSDTYPEDEYYPFTDVNAWQLCNCIYETNITEDEWEYAVTQGDTAVQELFQTALEAAGRADEYNSNGIAIGGIECWRVADYLCDTRTEDGQAGLDFVIAAMDLEAQQDVFQISVSKTLEGVPEGEDPNGTNFEDFTFNLQELIKVQDDGDYTEAIWSVDEENVVDSESLTIESWTEGANGTWTGSLAFNGALEYEAEDGTNFYYYILGEETPLTATPDQQYYGIKFTVTYSASTGVATVIASYCTLGTQDNYPYYRTSAWTGLSVEESEDENGERLYLYALPFVNTYNTTGFELAKVDVNGNALGGDDIGNAIFTMTTTQIEGEGTTLYFTVSADDNDEIIYTLASSDTAEATNQIEVIDGGPVYINGMAAGTYALTEVTAPTGYTTVDEFTITIDSDGNVTLDEGSYVTVNENVVNVVDVLATEINVSKNWIDNNNALQTRPEYITVTIEGSDGSTYELILNDYNNWNDGWGNLPTTDIQGNEITYTVTEELVSTDYSGTVVDNGNGTYTITNTLYGLTSISVEKDWVDNGNAYETRPDSITVIVTGSDGSTNTLTLTGEEGEDTWNGTLNNLPLYDSTGAEITYTVTEDQIEGYSGDVVDNGDGTYTITNSLSGTTDIIVTKSWVGDEDENSNRPGSIMVTITGSDESTYSLTLSGENDVDSWTATQSNLPLYDSTGTLITYEVSEVEVTGYDGDVVDNEDGTFTITNTLQTTQITVIKVWNDDENRDGVRPESISVQLIANGSASVDSVTIDSNDNWTYTWEDLPVYVNGTEITYTVAETLGSNAYASSTTSETDDDGNVTFTIANTHEDALTQITVNKEWQDNDDENGKRPGSVEVQLMANDEASGDPVTLDDSNGWSHTWEELYSFEDGELIEYTVKETLDSDDYKGSVGELTPVYDDDNNLTGYTIKVTNTRTGATEISVEKEWLDNENEYDTRPESITVTIIGTNNNGYSSTETLTLTDPTWSNALTELPLYDDDGVEIIYSVSETVPENYNGDVVENVDGTYTITNTLTGVVDISIEKVWEGDKASDRPDSIKIILYADEEVYDDEQILTSDNDWSYTFSNLPKYTSEGVEIVYTVEEQEVESGDLEGYIPSYSASEDGTTLTITNAMPEIHKFVSDPSFGESTDDDLTDDEAENNNKLEYKLEADHIGNAHDLTLHDYLDDQLKIDTLEIESVTLYEVDENTGEYKWIADVNDYELTTNECSDPDNCGMDGCSFEIYIPYEDVEGLPSNTCVIIIFDIQLEENADDFNDSYVDVIVNHTNLSFASFRLEPVEADTYSYGFDIFKYTGSDEPLEGAEFILTEEDEDGVTWYAVFEDPVDEKYLLYGWDDEESGATTIITGKDGNAIIEGLHDGTFTLIETSAPDGYSITQESMTIEIIVEDEYSEPTITVDGETAEDEVVRVENKLITGDLTIGKTVTGTGGSTTQDFTFEVELDDETFEGTLEAVKTDADGNETTIEITFKNGKSSSFTLKDGESIIIKGLPAGVGYTVTESDNDGYTVTISGDNSSGTLTADGVTVGFINHRDSTDDGGGDNPGGTRPNSNNGGGGGSTSSRGGSTAGSSGGPGTSGGSTGSSGEGDTWDLLPLPSTGEGRAMLFGVSALAISAMMLIVLLYRRKRED